MFDVKTKSFVILSIKSFENLAIELVHNLAEHLNIPIQNNQPWNEITGNKTDAYSGKFNNWNYRFHGGSCQFLNETNGQLIDVKMIGKDAYFSFGIFYLFEFLETHPSRPNKISSEAILKSICDELITDGILENIFQPPLYVLKRTSLTD